MFNPLSQYNLLSNLFLHLLEIVALFLNFLFCPIGMSDAFWVSAPLFKSP